MFTMVVLSVGPLYPWVGGFVRHYSLLVFFLLHYVFLSDLIYVLLCLTATSVCVNSLWRWISAVFFMCFIFRGVFHRGLFRAHGDST